MNLNHSYHCDCPCTRTQTNMHECILEVKRIKFQDSRLSKVLKHKSCTTITCNYHGYIFQSHSSKIKKKGKNIKLTCKRICTNIFLPNSQSPYFHLLCFLLFCFLILYILFFNPRSLSLPYDWAAGSHSPPRLCISSQVAVLEGETCKTHLAFKESTNSLSLLNLQRRVIC
jgi:hypothetical protein